MSSRLFAFPVPGPIRPQLLRLPFVYHDFPAPGPYRFSHKHLPGTNER